MISSRPLIAVRMVLAVTVALIAGTGFAVPAAAHSIDPTGTPAAALGSIVEPPGSVQTEHSTLRATDPGPVADKPGNAGIYAMSAGRIGAFAAAVAGFIGMVIGTLALARPHGRFGTGTGRLGAVVALAAGLTGMALGGLVVATSDAGIGTGNGRGGAYLALVVGLIAVTLGGLAMLRFRRAG